MACVVCLLFVHPASLGAADKSPVPDLTKGGKPTNKGSWNLGPTGAKGWMYGRHWSSARSRQILITEVEKGSPADGVLAVGDVILGVDGKLFDRDARKVLGRAITKAEETRSRGLLRLVRWRAGKQQEVVLKLRVLGSYSPTSPFNCAKSAKILEEGCRHLASAMPEDGYAAEGAHGTIGVSGPINALALLASGKPEYMDHVRRSARKIGPPDLKLKVDYGMVAWTWGYANLFLTEYYLATGDKQALHAIREYSTWIARGQSQVGTWGHGMAWPQDNNILGGYGSLNSAGLVCFLSLILAGKCGIQDKAVDEAIERSHTFFSTYINRGSIPYGYHEPWMETHCNNGKNGKVALAFDLLGNGKGADFFSRMVVASYDEREFGHTGNYFSMVWGPVGANLAGPEALVAYLKQQRWYYDLARKADGTFENAPAPGDSYSIYSGWDATGAYLLHLAIPLKKTYLTGKGLDERLVKRTALVGSDLEATLVSGRRDDYGAKSTEDLLEALANWSPIVRYRAAEALRHKKGDLTPQLIALLKSDDMNTQCGACEALRALGGRATAAVPALAEALKHEDYWLRCKAVRALGGIGPSAHKAVPAILQAMAGDDQRRWIGKRGADALGRIGSKGVPKEQLYPILKTTLQHPDGRVRSAIPKVYENWTYEELRPILPDICRAIKHRAPSGVMLASGVRMSGLKLLAKLRVREGMELCVEVAKTQNLWGSERRVQEIMDILKSYGSAARSVLPQLRAYEKMIPNRNPFPENLKKDKVKIVREAIKAIESAKESPELRSLEKTP